MVHSIRLPTFLLSSSSHIANKGPNQARNRRPPLLICQLLAQISAEGEPTALHWTDGGGRCQTARHRALLASSAVPARNTIGVQTFF